MSVHVFFDSLYYFFFSTYNFCSFTFRFYTHRICHNDAVGILNLILYPGNLLPGEFPHTFLQQTSNPHCPY